MIVGGAGTSYETATASRIIHNIILSRVFEILEVDQTVINLGRVSILHCCHFMNVVNHILFFQICSQLKPIIQQFYLFSIKLRSIILVYYQSHSSYQQLPFNVSPTTSTFEELGDITTPCCIPQTTKDSLIHEPITWTLRSYDCDLETIWHSICAVTLS